MSEPVATPSVPRYESGRGWRIELHATDEGAPNCRPLLRIFKGGTYECVAEVVLSDFSGCAQWFYEAELIHNLKHERGSGYFMRAVAKVRKALGYTYPDRL